MASNTLFPPIIDTTQPAFKYNDICTIYFKLSSYNSLNDIQGLLFTLVNQKTNKSVLNTDTFTAAQAYIPSKLIKQVHDDTYKFSFSVGLMASNTSSNDYATITLSSPFYLDNDKSTQPALNPDLYYKMQIRFVAANTFGTSSRSINPTMALLNSNLDNFSEWSTVTIFTPIYIPNINNFLLNTRKIEHWLMPINSGSYAGKGDICHEILNSSVVAISAQFDFKGCKKYYDLNNLINDFYYVRMIYYYECNESWTATKQAIGSVWTEILPYSTFFEYETAVRDEVYTYYPWQTRKESDSLESYQVRLLRQNPTSATKFDQTKYNYTYDSEFLYWTSEVFYPEVTNSNQFYQILKKGIDEAYITVKDEDNNDVMAPIIYTLQITYTTHYGYVEDWGTICTFERYIEKWNDINWKYNKDEAYMKLSKLPSVTKGKKELISILRSDNINKFEEWQTIHRYYTTVGTAEQFTNEFIDFTCQAGDFYRYKVVSDTGKECTKVEDSTPTCTLVDYDDMFLYGGNGVQLKIKYNPQVSSFKIKVSDSSYDTLGSAYPIVVRNGNLHYREISLGGLISMESDENELFLSKSERHKGIVNVCSYAEVGESRLYDNAAQIIEATTRHATPSGIGCAEYNVNAQFFEERRFREAVMEFLNDGKPKLLKSPSEGNIIIRLKDVSFTPNQQLGRMIYTFSCSAVEIAEPTVDNYAKFNLIRRDKYEEV